MVKGVAVEVLSKPGGDSEYHLESFQFTLDGTSKKAMPVSSADGQGTVATFRISKS